ncbi:PucR family transcriptional regulator [Streptomyces sp. NPDC001970]
MPDSAHRSTWQDVPRAQVRQFAALARDEVSVLAQEIFSEVRREFPQLPLILDEFGEPRALVGIRLSLEYFVDHMTTGPDEPHPHQEVFQDFGRGEGVQGRSLDVLQAIYRLGMRMAWRRFAEIGQRVGIPAPAIFELGEAGFEYLDGLIAESVRGYAEAAARQAGERMRLQRQLMDELLGGNVTVPAYRNGAGGRRGRRPGNEPAHALAELAARIGWALPERVAVAVLVRPAPEAVAPAVPSDVLLDMECDQPRMVVPDPDARGRLELLLRATAGWSGALGPPVPLADAAKSLRWAGAAIDLIEQGRLPSGRVLDCTEHIEALVLLPPEELIDDLTRRRLAPLTQCAPTQGRRLAETLLAWLESRGGAPEIAERLGVHPQTIRLRLRQIRELWGDDVDDPDRRFELELVLRARRLRGELGGSNTG